MKFELHHSKDEPVIAFNVEFEDGREMRAVKEALEDIGIEGIEESDNTLEFHATAGEFLYACYESGVNDEDEILEMMGNFSEMALLTEGVDLEELEDLEEAKMSKVFVWSMDKGTLSKKYPKLISTLGNIRVPGGKKLKMDMQKVIFFGNPWHDADGTFTKKDNAASASWIASMKMKSGRWQGKMGKVFGATDAVGRNDAKGDGSLKDGKKGSKYNPAWKSGMHTVVVTTKGGLKLSIAVDAAGSKFKVKKVHIPGMRRWVSPDVAKKLLKKAKESK